MEVFIPLIIFFVVSSVIRGLQKQAPSKGGPLPRPRAREDRIPDESPPPERPVRTRRESPRQEDKASAPAERPKYVGWQEKGRREPRLVKEGETPRPASRLRAEPEADLDPIVQQELQVMQTSPIGTTVAEKQREKSGNPLHRIKADLRRSRTLPAAILYGEILGAPRARKPQRTPLQNQ